MALNSKFDNLSTVVESPSDLRWEEISIWELRKTIWLEVGELVDLLKLLESSKIISFLWELDENGKVVLFDSYLDSLSI